MKNIANFNNTNDYLPLLNGVLHQPKGKMIQ